MHRHKAGMEQDDRKKPYCSRCITVVLGYIYILYITRINNRINISQVQDQVVRVRGGVGQGPILGLVGVGGAGRVPLYTCVETEGVFSSILIWVGLILFFSGGIERREFNATKTSSCATKSRLL